MSLFTFPSGPFATNCYVYSNHNKRGFIVDPSPRSAAKVLDCLTQNKITPEFILLTHSHWDHIADVAELKEKLSLPVAVHERDAQNLIDPGTDGLPCPLLISPSSPDILLKGGETLYVGDTEIQVIATPGHSPGGVVYYLPNEPMLFSGDTLFKGTIGNLSFPTSCPDEMWPSLEKIARLPPSTAIYPGHGESTTLKKELSWLERARELYS